MSTTSWTWSPTPRPTGSSTTQSALTRPSTGTDPATSTPAWPTPSSPTFPRPKTCQLLDAGQREPLARVRPNRPPRTRVGGLGPDGFGLQVRVVLGSGSSVLGSDGVDDLPVGEH